MTATPAELAFYAFGILLLFLTPGPVWVAVIARALTGGFAAAWPVAAAVMVGDFVWVLLAIYGITWITAPWGDFLSVLKWAAAVIFIVMGWLIIRHATDEISQDNRLTRPGVWAGFLAGLMVIFSNPKAVLFYMGVLPGFFDLSTITALDIAAILAISSLIPLLGNLILALSVAQIRALLTDPARRARLNRIAGGRLIAVGCVLPFT